MMMMVLVIILCTKVYTSTSEIIKRHLKNKKSLLKDVSYAIFCFSKELIL